MRDWVEFGAASKFVLSPTAAQCELGQHLGRTGRGGAAVEHFRASHRHQPENFSCQRQAWSSVPAGAGRFDRFWQGPVEGLEGDWPYESDWLSEVREKGAEHYYPAVVL